MPVAAVVFFVLFAGSPVPAEEPDEPVVVVGDASKAPEGPTRVEPSKQNQNASAKNKKKQKRQVASQGEPKVELSCGRRIGIGLGVIMAKVRIENPNEHLWCPKVSWEADGNFSGAHEGDCAPFEQTPPGDRTLWESNDGQTRNFYFREGHHTVVVDLLKAGRKVGGAHCEIYVPGGPE